MSVTKSEIRPGAYYDSVVLMQLQKALAELPGVRDAGVVMATVANLELLASSGMKTEAAVRPDDLLIAVKADDDAAADAALARVDELLASRRAGEATQFRPRSLEAAARQLPDAQWVLISVPGRYAAGVAHEALRLGRHVFLYSDNVALEEEQALKAVAAQRGLLVMGPDCGTAIVNGIGLGFANRVRRGPIGLVAAAGTGLQAVSSAIHRLGGGISQAIGTGGRDLSAAVGGATTLQGLGLLAADPATRVIVLISKPPGAAVAAAILGAALKAGKPVVVDFVGHAPPARRLGNLYFAAGLADAAELAVGLAAADSPAEPAPPERANGGRAGYVRGLFSGGTLAHEALLALQSVVQPVFSNLKAGEARPLANVHRSQQHTIVDMGADEFTQGKLHPMLDNDLRVRRIGQEAADAETGAILLDVVLGEGAHPDPAAELGPAIAAASAQAREMGRPLAFVAIVVGTDADPQGRGRQIEQLEAAGATVFDEVGAAIAHLAYRVPAAAERGGDVSLEAFSRPVAAINVGLESFAASLLEQGASVVQVEWRPPAGGNERLMDVLARMKRS